MNHDQSVEAEDLIGVKSRISWGAILGGAAIALAMYFLLTLLMGAVGLSISDKTTANTLSIAAAIWAIAITVVCLFAGGLVASHLTVGENKVEAALYGILVWAVVFAILVWLMATGVKAGFSAMVGVATAGSAAVNTAAQNTTPADWENAARQAGFSQAEIDANRQRIANTPADARAAAQDPANHERAEQAARDAANAATKITWWTFFGTWLSMFAAALGGFIGAGPTFRLVAVNRTAKL